MLITNSSKNKNMNNLIKEFKSIYGQSNGISEKAQPIVTKYKNDAYKMEFLSQNRSDVLVCDKKGNLKKFIIKQKNDKESNTSVYSSLKRNFDSFIENIHSHSSKNNGIEKRHIKIEKKLDNDILEKHISIKKSDNFIAVNNDAFCLPMSGQKRGLSKETYVKSSEDKPQKVVHLFNGMGDCYSFTPSSKPKKESVNLNTESNVLSKEFGNDFFRKFLFK